MKPRLIEETVTQRVETTVRRRYAVDPRPSRPPAAAVVETTGEELPVGPKPALASCPAGKVLPFRARRTA